MRLSSICSASRTPVLERDRYISLSTGNPLHDFLNINCFPCLSFCLSVCLSVSLCLSVPLFLCVCVCMYVSKSSSPVTGVVVAA